MEGIPQRQMDKSTLTHEISVNNQAFLCQPNNKIEIRALTISEQSLSPLLSKVNGIEL